MALISDITQMAMLEVPGASIPLVESTVNEIIREFCASTRIWVESLTPFNTVALTDSYAVATPTDTELVRIEDCKVDDFTPAPTTYADLAGRYRSTQWQTQYGQPREYYTQDEGKTIQFYPVADGVYTITPRGSLKPTLTTDNYPDFLESGYKALFASGAKGRLMLMSKVDWSNPDLGLVYMDKFEEGTAKARIKAARGSLRNPIRTRSNYF